MDEDNDLDCLIGDADGKVHFLRNDGNATNPRWTYITRDFFESDVGRYASPWCGFDKSGDGFVVDSSSVDVKCLVGNEAGYVQLFLKTNKIPSAPSFAPSPLPTLVPSALPTLEPTSIPSSIPTLIPTLAPSLQPTAEPSSQPSFSPSGLPSLHPTTHPSGSPTLQPTLEPTSAPSRTNGRPSPVPSLTPSSSPSIFPSPMPTLVPSALPSLNPTTLPTPEPSPVPTVSVWGILDRNAMGKAVSTGYASLSCGLFSGGGYMECAIGEADGSISHYLDKIEYNKAYN